MPEQPKEEPEKGGWIQVTMDGGGVLDMYVGESKDLPDWDAHVSPPKKRTMDEKG